MRFRLIGFALVLMAIGLMPADAHALWQISNLSNQSNIPVTVARPVAPGATLRDVAIGGNYAVVIPGKGVVEMIDIGHKDNPCQYPHWGVRITFNAKIWRFYYDGGGALGVTVKADGSVQLTGLSGGSQIVDGDGPPVCR